MILERIKTKNHQSWTFLSSAIKYGYLELCQIILDKFPDFSGCTPLHFAAEHNQSEIYKLFLKKTQEKCPIDILGRTPLHYAAEKGHFEVCRTIFENVQESNLVDNLGFSPLHLAVEKGFYEIFHLNIQNVQEKNPKGYSGTAPKVILINEWRR